MKGLIKPANSTVKFLHISTKAWWICGDDEAVVNEQF